MLRAHHACWSSPAPARSAWPLRWPSPPQWDAPRRSGLLITDSRVLETMGKIDVVVLDKTGTVTRGDFRLAEISLAHAHAEAFAMAATGSCFADLPAGHESAEIFLEEFLPILAGIENYSEHLLGRAVTQYAMEHRVVALDAADIEIHKGAGISGNVCGRQVFIGNQRMMTMGCCRIDAETELHMREFQEAGRTIALFGWDGRVQGILGFGDQIKEGAAEMIQQTSRPRTRREDGHW